MAEAKQHKSSFLRVRCECKNEQIIFERTATLVHCLVCNAVIAKPTGGKAKILARTLEAVQ